MQESSVNVTHVMEPSARVTIGGKMRQTVDSWSVTREISSGHPQRLSAGSGIVAASAEADIVTTSPFGNTLNSLISADKPFSDGDSCVIEAGYAGGQLSRLITGQVSELSHGIEDSVYTLSATDRIDRLNKNFSHEALIDVMPPHPSETVPRSVGVRAEYLVDYAIRRANFQTTFHPNGQAAVHVPLQGSVWPHAGSLRRSGDIQNDINTAARFSRVAWGYGLTNGSCIYEPLHRISGSRFEIVLHVDRPGHTGVGVAAAEFDSGTKAELRITQAGAEAYINNTQVASLESSAEIYCLSVTNGVWTLADNAGGRATGSGQVNGNFAYGHLSATGGAVIGGYSVSTPPTGVSLYSVVSWERTAFFRCGVLHEELLASFDEWETNIISFLKEVSEAQMTAMWLDERGNFHWVHPNILRSGTTVAEYTTEKSLFSYKLTDRLASKIGKVSVQYERPEITRSNQARRTVWQGSGETLGPNEAVTYLVSPAAGELWVGVDPVYRVAHDTQYRQGNHSFVGGSTDSDPQTLVTGYAMTWEKVKNGLWKIYLRNNTSANMIQRIPENAGFRKWVEGENLPIVRAKGYAKFVDDFYTSTVTGEGDREYTHKAGKWVQRPTHAQRLADYMAAHLTVGIVEIEGIEIVPDFGLQLGDHVRLKDPVVANLIVDGVVFSVEAGGSGPDVYMRLKISVVRVIELEPRIGEPSGELVLWVDQRNAAKYISEIDRNGGVN